LAVKQSGQAPGKQQSDMNTRILTLTAAMGGLVLGAVAHQALGETIYVDKRYGPGGTGTSNAPYNTIQAAINNANATVIIIYPGTYSESLNVTKSIKILGYDGPNTTRVEASGGGNVVTIALGLDVWIEGLTLSSGNYGVYQPRTGSLHLRNCVICGNVAHGIYLQCDNNSNFPYVWISNCILLKNGGSALYMQFYYQYGAYLMAFNNIFINNDRYGIEASYNAGYVAQTLSLDYNDYVGNVLGNYNGLFGAGNAVSAGSHSFSLSPEFAGGSADACNKDLRLTPTSPCKDAGQPGVGFLDPDGTRNDIGAYGGPAAQNFYTNPNDGPMIRSVTIDQGMVPRGSTFTIRGTGAVR
jgi:hypothetical protein